MTTTLYPEVLFDRDIIPALQEIARIRENEDVSEFENLNNRFVAGRGRFKQRSAPTAPNDVLSTDNLGDILNDDLYEYKLLEIGGVLLWDRRTLNTTW